MTTTVVKTSLKKWICVLSTLSCLLGPAQFFKCTRFLPILNSPRRIFTSSVKRRVKRFHVVVVQWTSKKFEVWQTSNVWRQNMSCLHPIRTCYFFVTCTRSDATDSKCWMSYNVILFQLLLVLAAVFAVVVYRAAVYAVLAAQNNYNMGLVSVATSGTAALLNLIIIMLLNKVTIVQPNLYLLSLTIDLERNPSENTI